MAIHLIEEDRNPNDLKTAALNRWLKEVIRQEGMKLGVINLVFCSDEYLSGINKKFMGREYLTDVISFDYSKKSVVSGDILISVDRVEENAREWSVSLPEEMKRVIVHGVLHLIGYKDNDDEKRAEMTRRENLYLERYGEWVGE